MFEFEGGEVTPNRVSYYALPNQCPSKLARSLFRDGADWSSTARSFLTRPPTGTPRRAISPGEGLPILFISR